MIFTIFAISVIAVIGKAKLDSTNGVNGNTLAYKPTSLQHMVIGIIADRPYIVIQKRDNQIVNVDGFVHQIVGWLSDKYNFSYTYVEPPDGNYGGISNGSWNGLIGMILRGEIDIAGTDLSITYARSSVVDFTYAFANDPVVLLMPYPRLASNVIGFVRPFQYTVWIGIISSLLLTAVAMWILSKAGLRKINNRFSQKKISEYLTLFGSIAADDAFPIRTSQPIRFVITVWVLGCMVFVQSYTSCLASYLMTPKFIPFVKSVEEFSNNDDMMLAVQKYTSQESDFLSASSGTIIGKLGNKLRAHPENRLENYENLANIIAEDKKVFAFEESIEKVYIEEDFKKTGQCRMITGKEQLFDSRCAFALPKRSPLTEIFDTDLIWLQEMGLVQHWTKIFLPKANRCSSQLLPGHQPKNRKKLTLDFLSSAFLLYGVGVVLSVIIFVHELIFYGCRMGGIPL